MADKKSDDVIKNQTGISKVFNNIINQRKKSDKQEKQDKPEKQEERAVNPMAIRPDNLKVSLNKPNKKIDAIKSLFGF
jgi:hypothetical protein